MASSRARPALVALAVVLALAGLSGCTGEPETDTAPARTPLTDLPAAEQAEVLASMQVLYGQATTAVNLVESHGSWPTEAGDLEAFLDGAGFAKEQSNGARITDYTSLADGYVFCLTDADGNWVLYDRNAGGLAANSTLADAPDECTTGASGE